MDESTGGKVHTHHMTITFPSHESHDHHMTQLHVVLNHFQLVIHDYMLPHVSSLPIGRSTFHGIRRVEQREDRLSDFVWLNLHLVCSFLIILSLLFCFCSTCPTSGHRQRSTVSVSCSWRDTQHHSLPGSRALSYTCTCNMYIVYMHACTCTC